MHIRICLGRAYDSLKDIPAGGAEGPSTVNVGGNCYRALWLIGPKAGMEEASRVS